MDHVIPLRKGGTDDDFNTLLAHLGCNRRKRDRLPLTSDQATKRHVTFEDGSKPGDVARVVLFLASDDSAWCTGAEFVVDGGMTA